MRLTFVLVSCLLMLAGCTHTSAMTTPAATEDPAATAVPTLPASDDENMTRSQVFIDSTEVLILESYPIQVNLSLTGSLPTPCHQLRSAITPPDEENRIFIDVYSVVDPDIVCIQVIEPFTHTISLGSFPSGHYKIYVNEALVAEFDS